MSSNADPKPEVPGPEVIDSDIRIFFACIFMHMQEQGLTILSLINNDYTAD